MEKFVEKINQNWNNICISISKFGSWIHGLKFHGGIYNVKFKNFDQIVISIDDINEDEKFWVFPIFCLKENVWLNSFNKNMGIESYEYKYIVKELQPPKKYKIDIDYQCVYHKKHKYIECDGKKCKNFLRFHKTMFFCETCNLDFCEEKCQKEMKCTHKTIKYICNCKILFIKNE